MKFYIKFFVVFTIFISLIAYCSFSFATDVDISHLTVDTSVVGSDIGVVDFSQLLAQGNGGSVSDYNSYTSSVIWVEEDKVFISCSTGRYYFDSSSNWVMCTSDNIGIVLNEDGSLYGVIGGTDDIVYYEVTKNITSNALFSDSSLDSYWVRLGVDSNNLTFFSGAFNKFVTMVMVVNSMATDLSLDTLWSIFQQAIPLIVICVLFVFGFILVSKISKGISKGKEKL